MARPAATRTKIPPDLVFVCLADKFIVVDKSLYKDYINGAAKPWLELPVGSGKIFETRPIKVIERTHRTVSVATKGYVVRINLFTGEIFNVMPDGSENEYRGGVVRSDAREGWIPLKRQ